ncbi:MAG: polyprenyl synthetase family protein [Limnohabitans sp.]
MSPATATPLADATGPARAELGLEAAMHEVDSVIAQRLASQVGLVEQVSLHIIRAGGKRLRPKLVLLFAQALGYSGPKRVELAAVVEFIHTATLLHDDVVDESALRRGQATANAAFGNAASVLVGDFLYSRAFQMMVSLNNMRVLEVLAEATNTIAEGEVLQLMHMRNADLTVDEYLRVIRFKTAKLFEASARLGAILASASSAVEQSCAEYGRCLGTCFQIVDDLLDYEGQSQELGKNPGDDLREGKATLPLLIALERGTPAQQQVLRQAIESAQIDRLADVIDIVRSSGALEATRQAAQREADRAQAALALVPAGAARSALLELSSQSVLRSR